MKRPSLHELGHSFGLDHHEYDDGIDCLMVGDSDLDCLEEIDSGSLRFCPKCSNHVRRATRRKSL